MAQAVLKGVLGSLSSVVEKEVGLFLGFDQDLKRLASLLTTIMATLEDAEEKQFSNRSIKDWLQKLKLAAYELDDIIDECAYEELRLEYEEVKCCLSEMVLSSSLSSFHPMHLVSRYKIAKKMKRISERLNEIAEEKNKFHLTEMAPDRRSGAAEWRETSSFITEPQVYGREEDKDKIVDFLVGDASHSEKLSVYPIVGLGGLGKTTLAQLIFNDERVGNHFELKLWICVSEDFSLKRMTKAIIEEASGHACEDLDLQPLQKKLRDLLERKRYLLVLDDVWDDEHKKWQRLKSVLACGGEGASILVTTRLPKVASIMGTTSPHELSVLSENDCWELFKHGAFAPNEEEHAELVDIGKEIVKKCGGVPLAAKTVGGLLSFKREEREWLFVRDSNLWSLPQSENSIMPALRLSYLNLPIKLRQCFAYCAIFPKDERIRKQDLIELWVANGFISSNGRLDAEDVGDGVWNELYWRSFFQDVEKNIWVGITFKMHDLVHDLAQFVAEDVCCITTDNGVTTEPAETIQHISDHRRSWSEPEELINSMHQVKYLRTYICQHDASIAQFPAHTLKRYPLRVLQRGGIKELSSSIGDLKHLRYLNLSNGDFETLPESLGKLWNLLILKLDSCRNLQKLPNSLVHLKALQQLSLNDCFRLSSLAPEIGKLSSLRILSKYIVGKERGFLLSELGPLKLKGDFRIEHLEKVKCVADAKEANMSIKQLNKLGLSWERNEEWELQENVEEILEVLQPDTQHLKSLAVQGYKGVHLPQWMSTSPSLKKLWLRSLPNLESLPDCIGSLPLLDLLSINKCEKLRCLPTSLSLLTSLKELWLKSLPNLESLPDCIGSLPLLDRLWIGECEKLRCLPTSLSLLTSLKHLWIAGCPELEKRCEKETGEDWPKIAHIPDIYIE